MYQVYHKGLVSRQFSGITAFTDITRQPQQSSPSNSNCSLPFPPAAGSRRSTWHSLRLYLPVLGANGNGIIVTVFTACLMKLVLF